MEDKKLKVENSEEKKVPSYDDLKNYCNQLLMQRNQVVEKFNQVTNVLNKLPWLFKVIENDKMFSRPFVTKCISEIELILTPPEASEEANTATGNAKSKD